MKYLVDTDWIIDGLGGNAEALSVLGRLSDEGVAVSAISVGEVLEGACSFPDPQRTIDGYREFIAGLAVLPVDDRVAARFAEIRWTLRRQGNLISDFNLLIAATALEHDLALLTRNVRHFRRIHDLRLYAAP